MSIEVQKFEAISPKQALGDRTAFIYVRASTKSQAKTLDTQLDQVKASLKALGYRKSLRGRIYQDVGSGQDIRRPGLQKALEDMLAFGKPAALVVRDVQRFTRDPYALGVLYRPLWDADIPLVALTEQLVLGTKRMPQQNADLLAPILVAAGGSEVSFRKKQALGGVAAAKALGIGAGAPMKVFTKEPLNPYRELDRLLKAGLGQSEASRRLGKSTSWFRKNRDKMAEIRERKGDDGVEEFLSLVDLIRDYEKEHGPRSGSRARNAMKAVGRMTNGYFQKPAEVERPTDEFVAEVFANPKPYLPKRAKRN